jgi:hypothetical protein
MRDALVLVTDNAQAGKINGCRISEGVPLLTAPGSASAASVVIRCESTHNDPRGERPKADEFRNVRKALHLRIGSRVILVANHIWGINTVPLGLMNGARGVVVAIVYASSKHERIDKIDLATKGLPSSDGHSFPRGLHCCPLPDFIVVHFSTYKGPALLSNDLPKTWVPIPCVEVHGSTRKSLVRVGVPLKLAWCLTIHKSQGITAQEGTIVSFKDSKMFRAVSRLGLAFVAWTRATTWSKVAFQSLPPLEDFLAVRMTKDFQLRETFEIEADKLHDALLSRRGITEESQLMGHRIHLQTFLLQSETRQPSEEEIRDLELMLQQRGVAPVSDSVQRWGQERVGRKAGVGLWTIVSSFRADKVVKDVGDKAYRKERQQKRIPESFPLFCVQAVLKEHGYDKEIIEAAIHLHGCSIQRCVEYCLNRAQDQSDSMVITNTPVDPVSEEVWASELISELGFDTDTVTQALESTSFSFAKAIVLLLNGNDHVCNKYRGAKVFRRHTQRKTMGLNLVKFADAGIREQYRSRARTHFQCDANVFDFGMYAGKTVNACFWLSLAAGLANAAWHIDTQALPGLADSVSLLQQLRTMDMTTLHLSKDVRLSPLGLFAEKLRSYMCAHDTAVLLRPDMQARLFPAFAAIDPSCESRQVCDYTRWVKRLADREFADELVVLATVLELKVRIVVIPYTPSDSARDWQISTYGQQLPEDSIQLVIGNNDVHYMWIKLS